MGDFLKYKKILFLGCILLMASSCVTTKEYRKSFHESTETKHLYSYETFAVEILWNATYLSPEYRAEARRQINEWMKLPPYEPGLYPDYLASNEEGTFIVSIYTPRGFPEITDNSEDFWEFSLKLASGESVMPIAMKRITVTTREKRLFPYINRWSDLYWVKFPVSYLTRPYTLALRSAGGSSFLNWKVKGSSQQP